MEREKRVGSGVGFGVRECLIFLSILSSLSSFTQLQSNAAHLLPLPLLSSPSLPLIYQYTILTQPPSEFSSRSVTSLPLAISHPPWRQSLSPLHSGCQITNRTEQHMFDVMRGLEGQVGWFVRAVQVSLSFILFYLFASIFGGRRDGHGSWLIVIER